MIIQQLFLWIICSVRRGYMLRGLRSGRAHYHVTAVPSDYAVLSPRLNALCSDTSDTASM